MEMYQFKISLVDSRPPIWRRVLVPRSFSFRELHKVIQGLFGWENCHMHDFYSGKAYRSSKIGKSWPLDRHFSRPKQKATYLYDFGDDWEHEIVFEKMAEAPKGVTHAICLDGANAAPPEDCGGLYGYYDILSVIQDEKHPEYGEMREWIGENFDPQLFEIERINKGLKRIKQAKPKKQVGWVPTSKARPSGAKTKLKAQPGIKKAGWKDVCPTCVKYEYSDHAPDCPHCRKLGVTEDLLCMLTRDDQENDPGSFQCGSYQPKQPAQ
ncbi:MAG: plasmid pRiA4b ORF-3 family protein [Pseudomonadota bacterium]